MNRTLHIWLGLAALFLAAVALPVAAQKGQQAFTETTEVVVVEIPVQVVKDGQPVRGLTVNDFEVLDGRKKQEIVGFEVLDLAAPAAPQQQQLTVPAAARRHFLMLFDLTFSEPKSIVQARKAARDVVDELHPTDLVAVATYSSSNGPQLLLGFTPDRQQIATAVETLGAPKLLERSPDPLRLVVSETEAGFRQTGGLGPASGNEQQQEVRAAREEAVSEYVQTIAEASARANRSNQEKLVTALTRSFADLAKLMSSVEGRKYVVYLSEGFDSTLATGAVDDTRQQEMNDAALSGEVWNVSSDERFGSTEALNDIEKMLEEFRRADCVIQAVDIGGLRGTDGGDAPRRASGRDSLFQMAKSTGGELYENFNDLSAAMGQMLQRTGVTYVLAIQPDKLKHDGSYRKLKVELKGAAAKGARVVHRPGYYAPKPYTAQSPLEKLLQTANQLTSGEESGAVASSVLAAPFRVSGDKAYVPVVVEIDGPSFLGNTTGTTLPVEIYIYALDDTGAVHDFVTQTFGLDLTKAAPALRQSGVKFFGDVDLLPGKYSLRVLVRNGITGASSLRVVDLEVPSFAKGDTALLPPFFPEPAGRWLMTRENQEPGQPQKPYPFMQKDQPYIPASKPVLAAGQEAAVSLVAYNLGTGDLKADAKVMTLDGKEVGTGQIKVLAREGGGAAGPDRLAATFRPPSLQPGEYVLQVTVSNGDGKTETSTTRFVVGAPGRGAQG
jgi:VWFA-related protein